MASLVTRAKIYAIQCWASDTMDEETALWSAFVLRLWSSDERIPQLACRSSGGHLQTLVQLVRRAIGRVRSKHTFLFCFAPWNALNLTFDSLREGSKLVLPMLSPFSADPTLVWGMCQQNGGRGVVMKLDAFSACPSWSHSICPEEREFNMGPTGEVHVKILNVHNGDVSFKKLFRCLDFPTRTFNSSEMLDFQLSVPDSAASSGVNIDLKKMLLLEVEELAVGVSSE